MNYEPQRFTAPDGTEMVVLRAADFERLRALAEDGEDALDMLAIKARIDAGEGTMPGEVLNMILDEDMTPLAAWRRYRGLSQAALARRAGLSQVWVGRIEAGGGYGSRETRKKLAAALEAPIWALENEDNEDKSPDVAEVAFHSRQRGSIADRILELVRTRPGMTELEIAKALFGPSAVQQNVNQECRLLVQLNLVERQGVGGRSDPYSYRAVK